LVFEADGDPEQALAILDAMPAPDPPGVELGLAGMFHGLAGNRARAVSNVDALLAASAAGVYVPPSQLAAIYVGLGDYDLALRHFRLAAQLNDPIFHWFPYLPHLRHVAAHTDFQVFLRDVGLKWQWRRDPARRPRSLGRAAILR